MKAETTFSLKDQLFNREKVELLASWIRAGDRARRTGRGARGQRFVATEFCERVLAAFPELELKQRIVHMTECLAGALPDDYLTALGIILAGLPAPLDPSLADNDFGDFIVAPMSHYVARYGCEREFLTDSLAALREITKRFSAEDAIRYFINAFPDETLSFLEDCARDDNYHVRRLASEGTRPKLPWSQKLTIHYTDPLPILEMLYRDPTRYVTRSVANHLNDISKIDAKLVVDTLARWNGAESASGGASTEAADLPYITRHAVRTLVKDGNAAALALLGYSDVPDVAVRRFVVATPVVRVGEALEFEIELEASTDEKLLIDYVMDFAGDGKAGGRKVFKLTQLKMRAGTREVVRKRHPLRLMTTRRLYEGEHIVTLQINGRAAGTVRFDLVA